MIQQFFTTALFSMSLVGCHQPAQNDQREEIRYVENILKEEVNRPCGSVLLTTNELMKMVPGTRAEYANGAIAIYMKSGTVIFEHEIKVGKISVFHRDHEAKYNIHYNDICITENLKNFCSPIIVAGGRYYKIHTLGGASDEPLTVSCEQVTFTKIER